MGHFKFCDAVRLVEFLQGDDPAAPSVPRATQKKRMRARFQRDDAPATMLTLGRLPQLLSDFSSCVLTADDLVHLQDAAMASVAPRQPQQPSRKRMRRATADEDALVAVAAEAEPDEPEGQEEQGQGNDCGNELVALAAGGRYEGWRS